MKKKTVIISSAAAIAVIALIHIFWVSALKTSAFHMAENMCAQEGWWRDYITYSMLSSDIKAVVSEEEFSGESGALLKMYRSLENVEFSDKDKSRFAGSTSHWSGSPVPHIITDDDGRKYVVWYDIDFDVNPWAIIPQIKVVNFTCHIEETAADMQKVEIPNEINGHNVSVIGDFGAESLLVNLYDTNGAIDSMKELGAYSLASGEYRKLFEYPSDFYGIADYNENYIVWKISEGEWWSDVSLHIYDIKAGEMRLISRCDSSGVILADGKVYFDNFAESALYQYDIAKDETVKIADNVKNPLLFEDTPAYRGKDGNLYAIDGSILEMNEPLGGASVTVALDESMLIENGTPAEWLKQCGEPLYYANGTIFSVALPDNAESVNVTDTVIRDDGNPKYDLKAAAREPDFDIFGGAVHIRLEGHTAAFLSSNLADYDAGACLRSFDIEFVSEDTEHKYTFCIRSDASFE